MLRAEQLCRHLGYVMHSPVRLYDADGNLLSREASEEDPLLCDPAFAAKMLALRREDLPALHVELDGVLYAVIPAEEGRTILLGPTSYRRGTVRSSRAVARAHGLQHPEAYHITYVPLDILLEFILLLFHSVSDAALSREDLALQCEQLSDYSDDIVSRTYSIVYQLRENDASHNSYAQEVKEQKAVREGDIDALRQSWLELDEGQIGRLGKDDVTHYRNLAVVVITLASRSAMEGGVLPEVAYSLADAYTMQVGELTDPLEITKLFRSAEIRFAELVRDNSMANVQNRHVLRCKELIHDRLHQRIGVEELAEELGLSRSYLSHIFLQEEGVKLSTYILKEKIRASEYLLMDPQLSLEQIAATFGFASQSHYGQVFKKFKGVTPGIYRQTHQSRK